VNQLLVAGEAGYATGAFNIRAAPAVAPARLEKEKVSVIRKLKSGEYRLYSKKKDPKTGKRRNLGTFKSRKAAEKHERAVQYFKRQ
jgi:hypothetical protein